MAEFEIPSGKEVLNEFTDLESLDELFSSSLISASRIGGAPTQSKGETAKIISGGISTTKSYGRNGIDVTVQVDGAKGAESLNILQIIRASNDDEFNEADAKYNKAWLSANGKEFGFVDNRGLYYSATERKEFVKFNSKSGSGTIHLVDHGSSFNDPSLAYKKTVVHSYIVAKYSNYLEIIGRMEWVFFKNSSNKIVEWSGNDLKVIYGNLTSTDKAIFDVNQKLK